MTDAQSWLISTLCEESRWILGGNLSLWRWCRGRTRSPRNRDGSCMRQGSFRGDLWSNPPNAKATTHLALSEILERLKQRTVNLIRVAEKD